jgi:hypothetical protein
MRILVPLVIEMTDEQVKEYVAECGLPHHDGPLRAKDIVEHVRGSVLYGIQEMADFGNGGADVSIKGR